jgi:cytochrome c-type biogenesis protein CcsB
VIDVGWAQTSNDLLTATVLLYALAMLAFAGEYAQARGRGRATGERRRRLVVHAAVDLDTASLATSVPVPDPRTRAPGARLGHLAVLLTVVGFLTHAGSVLSRGLAAHRVPWGNMYEFSSAIALSAVAGFLVLLVRRDVRFLGVFVMAPVVLTLGIASTLLYSAAEPLQPALNDYWIKIHVVAAIVSWGAFTVGAVTSVLFLLARRFPDNGLISRIPTPERLDALSGRVHAFAFPIWTFAIVSGAIWAERAWGRYWGWDPKETWSFIAWLVYAGYLHARATGGWKGRPAAWIALAGFSTLTIDYYLVNTVIVGLHSYAGV